MAEYIEREAAMKIIEDLPWKNEVEGIVVKSICRSIIEDTPSADVVEVRHEHWDENIIGFCNVCIGCGAIVERTAIKNKSGELNYCPNCGARMDGKENNYEKNPNVV